MTRRWGSRPLQSLADGAAVRDTKDRSAGYFTTTGTQWAAFIDAVKSERFE